MEYAVSQPSRFFIVSPNGDILLKIDVFCSKGNPILPVRDVNPSWHVPNEQGPSFTTSRSHRITDHTYQHPEQPTLDMVWGEYHHIGFRGPDHFTAIGAEEDNPDVNFMKFLEQSVEQQVAKLKANEERSLIQSLQVLSAENQDEFIVNHNANLGDSEELRENFEQVVKFVQDRPLRNRHSNVCAKAALKVAMSITQKRLISCFNSMRAITREFFSTTMILH